MLENDPDAAFIASADDTPVAETEVAEATPAAEENKAADEAPAEAVAETEPAAAEAVPAEDEPEAKAEGEDEGDKSKSGPWVQKRFNQITREKYEAQRERDAYKALYEASLAGTQQAGDGEPPAVQPPKPAPDMTEAEIARRAALLDAQRQFDRTCNEIYAEGEKAFKGDWQQAVATLGVALPAGITRDLVDAAVETGDAHKLFYHLGKNPDMAQEIAELPPARMAVRLAKLATDLNKPAAPKPVSQAPAPVKPIGGGSTSVETDPEKMSTEQWMKWHDEQQEKRRRRA